MSISAGWLVFVVDFFELHICFVNSALISHMVCKYFIPFYRLSFVSFLVSFAVQRFNSWLRKIFWRRDRLPSPVFLDFPGHSIGKEPACNAGDLGSIPGFGKIPRRREWLPTPAFWLGEFHGLYSPWGRKESDTTERLSLSLYLGEFSFSPKQYSPKPTTTPTFRD